MSKLFKIYNQIKALTVQKPSNIQEDRSNDIIVWDVGQIAYNAYPLRLLKSITESPTAHACLKTRQKYVMGSGFNIPTLHKIKVNKEDTFITFHRGLSETATKLHGIAIHVRRHPDGKIAEIRKMQFEDFRLKLPNEKNEVTKVIYNPRWEQTEFKRSESVEYDLYESDPLKWKEKYIAHIQDPKNKGKYSGEIYWDCIKKDGYPFYPYAFSEYDIKAFETDSQFTNFDYNNIYNNFLLGSIINVYGDPNERITESYQTNNKDELGNYIWEERFLGTRGELFDREMQKNFGGAENGGKTMVNWVQNEEQNLNISPFPTNTNSDLFQQAQDRSDVKISRITGVPNVLAHIQQAGKLGDNQEVLNAIQLINDSVDLEQDLLETAYNELLPKSAFYLGTEEVKIKKRNPISFIPDQVWTIIPDKSKLKYISNNYDIEIDEEIIEPTVQAEQEINGNITNLTGRQMQNIQRIVRKFKNGDITEQQALLMLKEGFGFNDEQAAVWLDDIEGNENVKIVEDGV